MFYPVPSPASTRWPGGNSRLIQAISNHFSAAIRGIDGVADVMKHLRSNFRHARAVGRLFGLSAGFSQMSHHKIKTSGEDTNFVGPVGIQSGRQVVFDPNTAEYWNDDRRSGWMIEALSAVRLLGIDQNNAHVQPDGSYHYHALPNGLVKTLGGDEKKMRLFRKICG